MNVFEAVKQSVTTRQAASFYGIRVGRNGMACCPFHQDRTPSMKVDSRFYCFGCGASGDVIDFTASLHGLGKRDAAVRLAEDFSIPYEDKSPPDSKRSKPPPRRKSEEQRFRVLSRQKETYKVPYETHPADQLRQCVFAGTTNRQDFLPRDRTGNRRFLPVTVYPERAAVHILDDEAASRAYIDQMWAEAMAIYKSGRYRLSFSAEMNDYLKAHQQDFMQEDTQAGMIYAYLEDYTGDRICSKQLYEEALGNCNAPADWETRAICEIMNTGIANGSIQGWTAYKSPKRYKKYGTQKGWERVNQTPADGDGFREIKEEEARQMELPF